MRSALLAGALVLVAGAGAATATVLVRNGEALPGTTVAGVDVGGLGAADIARMLAPAAQRVEDGTLTLVGGGQRVPVRRAALGVQVDLAATARAAVQADHDPLTALSGPLRGTTRSVPLSVGVDAKVVRAAVQRLADDLDRDAEPGGFTVAGTTVRVQQPAAGTKVDVEATAKAVERALRGVPVQGVLDVPVQLDPVPPPVTAERIEQVAGAARRALQEPYRLVAGEVAVELPAATLGRLLSGRVTDGTYDLVLDRDGLAAALAPLVDKVSQPGRAASFAIPGQPATFDVKGSTTWTPKPAVVSVIPGQRGRRIDLTETVSRFAALVYGVGRQGELPLDTSEPDLTTQQARDAGVTTLLSTFTTYFKPGQPRVTNIRRIAQIVNGTYLAPGEVFSLNGTVGRRTRAKGFVADGAILNGELVDQVGGGVSQFATTTFNAAYFAGLDIEQYQAHSFYISRYPPGRESTVNFPTIDVKFRNDTAHGLLVRTASTPTSVTVSLYGDNGGRRVQSITGPRQPRSDGGFRIQVTRLTSGGDGVGGRRVFTTTYKPSPE